MFGLQYVGWRLFSRYWEGVGMTTRLISAADGPLPYAPPRITPIPTKAELRAALREVEGTSQDHYQSGDLGTETYVAMLNASAGLRALFDALPIDELLRRLSAADRREGLLTTDHLVDAAVIVRAAGIRHAPGSQARLVHMDLANRLKDAAAAQDGPTDGD
jgi:hypothetical protein